MSKNEIKNPIEIIENIIHRNFSNSSKLVCNDIANQMINDLESSGIELVETEKLQTTEALMKEKNNLETKLWETEQEIANLNSWENEKNAEYIKLIKGLEQKLLAKERLISEFCINN